MGRFITNILLIAILIVLIGIGKNYYDANRTQIMLNDVVYEQNNNQNSIFKELAPIYIGWIIFVVIGISIGATIKKSKEEIYKDKNNDKLTEYYRKK